MSNMLDHFKLFQRASYDLIQGQKIDPVDYPPEFVENFYKLLMRMHRLAFVTTEPQCYIKRPEYAHIDPVYMGQTDIHPVMHALHVETERTVAVIRESKEPSISEPMFLGMGYEGRNLARESKRPVQEDQASILTRADVMALYQSSSIIVDRLENPNIHYSGPHIIQDPHFWWEYIGPILKDENQQAQLQKAGIFFAKTARETTEILAAPRLGSRIDSQQVQVKIDPLSGIENPQFLFATSDSVKFGHVSLALQSSGFQGNIYRATDVLGRYEIPEEKRYSFEGNAFFKTVKLISQLRAMGEERIRQVCADHGLNDISQIVLLVHDGGVGTCLENNKGDRHIGFFSNPRSFPDTHGVMNKMQMDPGVELAHLYTTSGFGHAMELWGREVKETCARDKRFSPHNARAYDTAIQMVLPLTRVLEGLKNGKSPEQIAREAVCVGDAQRLKVSFTPYFTEGSDPKIPRTDNYLYSPDSYTVRALEGGWEYQGPNFRSFGLVQAYGGMTSPCSEKETKLSRKVNVGMLAIPAALYARGPTGDYNSLRSVLSRLSIRTRQGSDFWERYKGSVADVLEQASNGGSSNSAHAANIRSILNDAGVVYFGHDNPLPNATAEERERAKWELRQLFMTAVVYNQVLNPIPIVVNPNGNVKPIVELIRTKQMMGLVGQKEEFLYTCVDGYNEAAKAIAEVGRSPRKCTELVRQFYEDGQVESTDCVTATAYFSASNRNETWVRQAERLGYLYAVNGFSLKVGGGKDGLMKAVSDGFVRGKRELVAKGYDFPNQLILIQCEDTRAIEGEYECSEELDAGFIVYRCHPDIQSRQADLQIGDFKSPGAGGVGTDLEIADETGSRLSGLVDPKKSPMVLFNQQGFMRNEKGLSVQVGVHDLYPKIMGAELMKKVGISMANTPEEIITIAHLHRTSMPAEIHALPLHVLRKHKDQPEIDPALTQRVKWFRPPYDVYTGVEGGIPHKVQTVPVNPLCRHIRQMA